MACSTLSNWVKLVYRSPGARGVASALGSPLIDSTDLTRAPSFKNQEVLPLSPANGCLLFVGKPKPLAQSDNSVFGIWVRGDTRVHSILPALGTPVASDLGNLPNEIP